jgi:hypothetical protein
MNVNFITGETLFSPIPLGELLKTLKAEILEALSTKQEKELQEKLLSPTETCNLFYPKISKPTLIKYTKEGKLQEYRIGGRVYYKYSEVLQALKTLKKYQRKEVYNG